jgi:RNA polymerase sigma factor (sigma-70 family)
MTGRQVPPLLRFIRTIGPSVADSDVTDGQLLARFVRQREEAAFTALFRRHGPMVWSVCHRVLADNHAAEDAFQATFLVFLRKASSIDRPELMANYLYGIAYRTAAKAKTLRARQRVREEPQSIAPLFADNHDDSDWRDLRPVLDEEMQGLPENYRAPLVLCYLEGKTYAEAARLLGWAEGTVSGRLARARNLLRARLIRRGLALSAGSLAVLLAREAAARTIPFIVEQATARAVWLSVTASPAALATVSPQAAALSKGVLHAMFLSQVKIAAVVVLTVSLIGTGAGIVTHCVRAADRRGAQGETLTTSLARADQLDDAPAASAKQKQPEKKDKSPSATSPDGKLVAKARDKEIGLFDADSGKEVRRMAGHEEKVTALAFSPDGKSLASGSKDTTVILWHLPTGKILWKFTGTKGIVSVKYSEDGRSLAVEAEGRKTRKLDAETGKVLP